MTWSNRQKQLAARAAKAAGMTDEHRKLILLQLGNRAIVNGQPSSTSPNLTQGDFEHFMAVVEDSSGGHIKVADKNGTPIFSQGKFSNAQEGELRRKRHVIQNIVRELELAGLLEPHGVGLAGWINSRVPGGEAAGGELAGLDYKQTTNLLNGLSAYARRNKQSSPQPKNSTEGNPHVDTSDAPGPPPGNAPW